MFNLTQFVQALQLKPRYSLPSPTVSPYVATDIRVGDVLDYVPGSAIAYPIPSVVNHVKVNGVDVTVPYTVQNSDLGLPIQLTQAFTNVLGTTNSSSNTSTVIANPQAWSQDWVAVNGASVLEYSNNWLFNNAALSARTYYFSGTSTTGVPVDSNGWPTVAFDTYVTASIAGVDSGAGQLPIGTYFGLFKSVGQATNITVAGGTISNVVLLGDGVTTTFKLTISSNTNTLLKFSGPVQYLEIPRDGSVPVPGTPQAEFFPAALAHYSQFSSLRFMDFLETNTRTESTWASRSQDYLPSRPAQTFGMPWERCVRFVTALANYPGSRLKQVWLNVSGHIDDDYATQLATLFNTQSFPSSVQIIWELGNEQWNTAFNLWHYYGDLAFAEVGAITNYGSQANTLANITGNGTTATAKVARLPPGLTTGTYPGVVASTVGGAAGSAASPVTLTVVDANTVTWPSTYNGTTSAAVVTGSMAPNSCTGSISGTTLTISAINAGSVFVKGMAIIAAGIPDNTTISTQLTGTNGGVGTYTISSSLTIASTTIAGSGVGFTVTGVTSGALAVSQSINGINMPIAGSSLLKTGGTGTTATGTYVVDIPGITGSISGTTLTVTTGYISPGATIFGNGVTTCVVQNQLSGITGSTGTYQVSVSQTVTSRLLYQTFTMSSQTFYGYPASNQSAIFPNPNSTTLLSDDLSYNLFNLTHKWYIRRLYQLKQIFNPIRPQDKFVMTLQQFGGLIQGPMNFAPVHFDYGNYIAGGSISSFLYGAAIAPYVKPACTATSATVGQSTINGVAFASTCTVGDTLTVTGIGTGGATMTVTVAAGSSGTTLNINETVITSATNMSVTYVSGNSTSVVSAIRAMIPASMKVLLSSFIYMCKKYNLRPMAYEGGPDTQTTPTIQYNVHKDSTMANMVTEMLDCWYQYGGKDFHYFAVGPAYWSNGQQGAWSALQLFSDVTSPKFAGIVGYQKNLTYNGLQNGPGSIFPYQGYQKSTGGSTVNATTQVIYWTSNTAIRTVVMLVTFQRGRRYQIQVYGSDTSSSCVCTVSVNYSAIGTCTLPANGAGNSNTTVPGLAAGSPLITEISAGSAIITVSIGSGVGAIPCIQKIVVTAV